MSSEMIDRVAEALYNKQKDLYVIKQLEFKDSPHKYYWWSIARAAIEAMREPTDEMIDAAAKSVITNEIEPYGGWYTAMIDAALNEKT